MPKSKAAAMRLAQKRVADSEAALEAATARLASPYKQTLLARSALSRARDELRRLQTGDEPREVTQARRRLKDLEEQVGIARARLSTDEELLKKAEQHLIDTQHRDSLFRDAYLRSTKDSTVVLPPQVTPEAMRDADAAYKRAQVLVEQSRRKVGQVEEQVSDARRHLPGSRTDGHGK